jgi:hypothetical protein
LPTRPNKDIPEPWPSFLRELDGAVHEDIRLDCLGGFVISMVYGFSRPTGDLDVLEIAPREAGRPMLELGKRGGPLHKKYKIYLDHVGVVHVPENYEERLTEIFPKVFKHLRVLLSTLTISLCQSWSATSSGPGRCAALGADSAVRFGIAKVRYQKELRWQLGNPEREDLTLRLWIEAIQEERSE